MSFINFNNKSDSQGARYTKNVIKSALLKIETKNEKKVDSLLEGLAEKITLNEALELFSQKLLAMSALDEARLKTLREVNESAEETLADDVNGELFTAWFDGTVSVTATTTNKTWDDGVPVLKELARGRSKTINLKIKGEFSVVHDVAHGWFYFTDGNTWYGLHQDDGYTDIIDLPFNTQYSESEEIEVNERSINKIQKEFTRVTGEMKATVDAWKTAEGDSKIQLLDKLKTLTKEKNDLATELDLAVMGKDKDVELVAALESVVTEGKDSALQDYVEAASQKTFKGGGNGQNLLDGAMELANHIDNYRQGRDTRGYEEDGFYGPLTITAFKKLVDQMSADDIKNNQADKYEGDTGFKIGDKVKLTKFIQDAENDETGDLHNFKRGDKVEITDIDGKHSYQFKYLDKLPNERYWKRQKEFKANVIKESVVTEADINDPVLIAFRAAKMKREKELAKPKRKPLYGKQRQKAEDQLWDISQDLKDLYADRGQMLIDMEEEAEAEGGTIADEYGTKLNKIEADIQTLISKRSKLEMMLAESKLTWESLMERINRPVNENLRTKVKNYIKKNEDELNMLADEDQWDSIYDKMRAEFDIKEGSEEDKDLIDTFKFTF